MLGTRAPAEIRPASNRESHIKGICMETRGGGCLLATSGLQSRNQLLVIQSPDIKWRNFYAACLVRGFSKVCYKTVSIGERV